VQPGNENGGKGFIYENKPFSSAKEILDLKTENPCRDFQFLGISDFNS